MAHNYDRTIARLFSDPSTEDNVYTNMQISIADLVTGKMKYDLSVNEKLSLSSVASHLGYSKDAVAVLSWNDQSKLVSIVSNPALKVIVVLIAEEYYSKYVRFLRIAGSPRCMHKGVLFLQYYNRPLILVNRREAWSILPSTVRMIFSFDLKDAVFFNQRSHIVAANLDETCNEACLRISTDTKHYICNENQLQFLNRCPVIRQYFPCEKGCEHEVGQDLPVYVNSSDLNTNGFCLFSTDVQPICDYSIQVTQRLCTCTEAHTIVNYGFSPPVLVVTRQVQQQMRIRKHNFTVCYKYIIQLMFLCPHSTPSALFRP